MRIYSCPLIGPFLTWDVSVFADKMNSLNNFFDISKERGLKILLPLLWLGTPHLVACSGVSVTTEIPLVSSGRDQLSVGTAILRFEDRSLSPTTNNNRYKDQDQCFPP